MTEAISPPALQVIILGSGGGPQESNTTAFLVRSVPLNWRKGSIVAVDGGVHLSAITRLIEEALPDSPPPTPTPSSVPARQILTTGPFAGLELPFTTAAANAAHVTRTLVDTYLITHPHLDHISAFVINTAGLPGTRPKKLAGLPGTIKALKDHIFNNVIWPNLSDENNGAGLLTYLRLVEGGSPALGEGYLEVCDGLLVKTWSVSHGHCMEKHTHRGSFCNPVPTRHGSQDGSSIPLRRDTYYPHAHDFAAHFARRETFNHLYPPTSFSRRPSMMPQAALGGTSTPVFSGGEFEPRHCVNDSSAYFIREETYEREVLIFGDVEPDSLSLSPRNLLIWQEAAPKIASGKLAAIFVECSYSDAQPDERLFGHLKPAYLIEEMQVLAGEVEAARKVRALESKKRKRDAEEDAEFQRKKVPIVTMQSPGSDDPVSPKSANPFNMPADYYFAAKADSETPHIATPTGELSLDEFDIPGPLIPPTPAVTAAADSGIKKPLEGLKVVIIHVKETLADGPQAGESILQQLNEHERGAQLGCEFIISKPGQSFYF
ncbi:cyclic-amp phosphodiesterase, class-ii [Trichoderma arundinaceum]|uniref:Cyclic-amp phosphodiesterase, class-ii n=1 Tax=Trichoderma arundinaceum TaxID=490622 RepID=A0A395NTH7_TRIAR|nr:cyclic-amp phosphodiesterase, class-ii [Trichoderma arundinaceum]